MKGKAAVAIQTTVQCRQYTAKEDWHLVRMVLPTTTVELDIKWKQAQNIVVDPSDRRMFHSKSSW